MSKKKIDKPKPSGTERLQARVFYFQWERQSLALMDAIDAASLLETIAEAIAWGRDQAQKAHAP